MSYKPNVMFSPNVSRASGCYHEAPFHNWTQQQSKHNEQLEPTHANNNATRFCLLEVALKEFVKVTVQVKKTLK